MNDTTYAISQDELGGPEVLKRVTVPTPEPGTFPLDQVATAHSTKTRTGKTVLTLV